MTKTEASMTRAEALELARCHVLSQIQLVPCVSPPETLYGFDPGKSFLFMLAWPSGSERVGRSIYLIVSRETGDVTMLHGHGE